MALLVSAQVSLYYDLLPAACSGVSQAEFVSGRCGKGLARGRVACPARAAAARRLVWTELRPFRMVEAVLPGSVADPDPPDPNVFGPPGSGSISQTYGSGSGSCSGSGSGYSNH
jgi:hypothetical protein